MFISVSKVSFFGLMYSHIQADRFRGGAGIGDRGIGIAKRIMRRDYTRNIIKLK